MDLNYGAGVLYSDGSIDFERTGITAKSPMKLWAKRRTAAGHAAKLEEKAQHRLDSWDPMNSRTQRPRVPVAPVLFRAADNVTELADEKKRPVVHQVGQAQIWFGVFKIADIARPLVSIHQRSADAKTAADDIPGTVVGIVSIGSLVGYIDHGLVRFH